MSELPRPYYADQWVTVYHGDCRELLPLLQADIVLTDPPYGIGVRYGEGFDDKRVDYWTWLADIVALMRATAPLVVFSHRVSSLAHVKGWDWVGVWHKPMSTGVRLGNSCVLPHWEPIYLYGIHSMGTASAFTGDVWTVNPQRTKGHGRGREAWAEDTAKGHPTPKPITLLTKILSSIGQNARTVIDPFAGSGTTLRAAKDMGLKAIGIEIEERYCLDMAERMSQDVLDLWRKEGVS